MRGQYLYEPDPSSAGPRGPLKRLLASALLVSGLAVLIFLVAPYVVKDAPPPQPTPTATLPPATPTSVVTATPTSLATPTLQGTPGPTPTPYPGFSASFLDQLDLQLTELHTWTNADWHLFLTSKQLDSFVVDPQVIAQVAALKPEGAKMQIFVQTGDVCTQPFCQVSWVGIVFPTPQEAYQALMLFNVIYDTNAPELKLAYSYQGASPTPSSVPTPGPGETGTAMSFCYVWKNMFIRISTLSQYYPSMEDVDQSMNLVHEIFASWGKSSVP